MSVPRSVADVIRNHVTLEVEGIDRLYLNVYQPKLQTEKQAACFFRYHRGQPVASSSLMGVMTNAYLQQVDDFVAQHDIPVVQFRKGQRKDDVAAGYPNTHSGTPGPFSSRYGIAPNTIQVRPLSNPCDPTLPSTRHIGGMNVTLADGSVRSVSATISFATWTALTTPAGGEVFGSDW